MVQGSRWKCVVGKPAWEVRSELLAKEDAASGDREAGGLVDALGKGIGDVGVRGHFRAALCARPTFRGVKKRGTDALTATRFRDEPTFHVAYRLFFVAAIGGGAQIRFEKASQRAVVFFGDKNHQGIDALRRSVEHVGEFGGVVRRGRFRPQRAAHRSELRDIGQGGKAYAEVFAFGHLLNDYEL